MSDYSAKLRALEIWLEIMKRDNSLALAIVQLNSGDNAHVQLVAIRDGLLMKRIAQYSLNMVKTWNLAQPSTVVVDVTVVGHCDKRDFRTIKKTFHEWHRIEKTAALGVRENIQANPFGKQSWHFQHELRFGNSKTEFSLISVGEWPSTPSEFLELYPSRGEINVF